MAAWTKPVGLLVAGGLHFFTLPTFADIGEGGTDQCQLEKPTPLWTRPMTMDGHRCWLPWPAFCVLWTCGWTLPPLLWDHSSRNCYDPLIALRFSFTTGDTSLDTTARDTTPDPWPISGTSFPPLTLSSWIGPPHCLLGSPCLWCPYRTFCMYSKALICGSDSARFLLLLLSLMGFPYKLFDF